MQGHSSVVISGQARRRKNLVRSGSWKGWTRIHPRVHTAVGMAEKDEFIERVEALYMGMFQLSLPVASKLLTLGQRMQGFLVQDV